MDFTATITAIDNDPDNKNTISVPVDYNDGKANIVSKTYLYNSINLTDPQQVLDMIQIELQNLKGFQQVVDTLIAQVGKPIQALDVKPSPSPVQGIING